MYIFFSDETAPVVINEFLKPNYLSLLMVIYFSSISLIKDKQNRWVGVTPGLSAGGWHKALHPQWHNTAIVRLQTQQEYIKS